MNILLTVIYACMVGSGLVIGVWSYAAPTMQSKLAKMFSETGLSMVSFFSGLGLAVAGELLLLNHLY